MYSQKIQKIFQKKEISIGDKIRVKGGQVYEGILMPRPDFEDENILVLKLENGYNIGVRWDEKTSITKIKASPKKIHPKPNLSFKHDPKKPTVSIISTGGTISSRIDYRTGGVYSSFTAEDLLRTYPELKKIANIKTLELMNVMSEDMNPGLWKKIAKSVAGELEKSDGVVITHGTDTMGYTSAALTFMLQNLGKPVAVTGSQRSSDRGSSDAFLNLMCSVIWAKSKYAGVSLVMHGSMDDSFCLAHPGKRVRKMHTSRRDAFKSINSEPWAKIYPTGKIETLGKLQKRSEKKVLLKTKIEKKVALIKIYPGMDPGIIDYYINKKFRGLVFEGTGLGHVPTSLIPEIERAKKNGITMVMTSQCLYGRVHPFVYSNLRKLSSIGVIYCGDMLPETAYIKLMWVLGQTKNPEKIKEMMLSGD